MSRLVTRAEKGIINWVCWRVNRDHSFEDALDLIKRADNGELWLEVINDIAFFSVYITPIGELHCKGVLAAGEWGPEGPEGGFDAFQEHWDEYTEEQDRANEKKLLGLIAEFYPEGVPESVCPV